jgi:MFS family permease
MLADVVPTERSGTAVGLFRFCGDLGFTLGPLLAGFTATAFGFEVAFAVAAVPTVIALLLAVRTEETLSNHREDV